MANFIQDPLPGLPHRPLNGIYYPTGNGPQLEQHCIKSELTRKSSCSRTARDVQEPEGPAGIECDKMCKAENSPSRSLSPEFLLKSSVDHGKNGEYKGMEKEEGSTADPGMDNTIAANDITTPVTCVYCNEVFPNRDALEQHQHTVHDGKKLYDCSMCEKQFNHRSSRNIHLRVHTGQRPYECEICKKRFRVSSHLRDHVRTHTGERPFKCVLCGRGFKQSSDMKKHRKTHYKSSPSLGKTNKEKSTEQETSYMIVRSDDVPTTDDIVQNGDLRSPTDHPKNLKLVIKMERKVKDQNGVSPLSSDSGIKVESDTSGSPENATREKSFRYKQLARQTPALNEVGSTPGWPRADSRDVSYNGSLDFNGHESVPSSAPSFFQPLRSNVGSYRLEDNGGKRLNTNGEKSFHSENRSNTSTRHEQRNKVDHYNGQFVDSHNSNSPSVRTQNNNVVTKFVTRDTMYAPNGKRPKIGDGVTYNHDGHTTVHSEQTDFSRFWEVDNTEISVFASRRTGNEHQGDGVRTPVEDKTSESPVPESGTIPRDVSMTLPSEVSGVGKPSEQAANDQLSGEEASEVSRQAQVIRKPVNEKQRSEKTNSVLKRNTMNSPRRQARQAKKGREGSLQCSSCMERFRSMELFSAHTCGKSDKSFKCSVCGKTFARSTLLRQHMVLHQGSKRFKFKCNYCGRAFRHRSHLRDHERIHTGERPFKCSFCPKAFKQSSDLRKHENLHTGATRYRCEKCALDFKRCDALKKHALLHADGEVTLLKCEKCQSLFATADGHSSHVCQNRIRYRCQLCVQRFSNAASLRQHCHEKHGDQSNESCLKCEFCKLELKSLDELEVHLGTHQLLKTHQCTTCDQRFSLISQLEEHIKVHAQNDNASKESARKSFCEQEYPNTNNTELPPMEDEADNQGTENQMSVDDDEENIVEVNTAATPLSPVLSPSNHPARHTYDFIPSTYQSLVHSVATHGFIENGRWGLLPKIKGPGSYYVPRLVKPDVPTQHEREDQKNGNDAADEIVQKYPTTAEGRRSSERAAEVNMPTEVNMADGSLEDKVEKHFSQSLSQEISYPKRTYTCLNCTVKFHDERTLVGHVCDIQAVALYQCLVCETEYASYEDLQGHMRNHWKQVVYLKCNLCDERVRNEELLKEHNLKHIKQNRANSASEEPGSEREKEPTTPSALMRTKQIRTFSSGTEPDDLCSSSVTVRSTPVITSVSSFLSKGSSRVQIPANVRERSVSEYCGSERSRDERSPPRSPLLANETTGKHERSLAIVNQNETGDNRERSRVVKHAAKGDGILSMAQIPPSYMTYFDTRKSVPGAYMNVFGQGSAMVVSTMHAMDPSGRYPGRIYPVPMGRQPYVTEHK